MNISKLIYAYLGSGNFFNDTIKKLGANTEGYNYKSTLPQNASKQNNGKFYTFVDNSFQIDLMEFIEDNHHHKYCMNVVNLKTRISDVEPMESKSSEASANAFSRIFKRPILRMGLLNEIILFTDVGSEFKGAFKKLCDDNNISIVTTRPGHKNDMAIVESNNRLYKTIILRYLTVKSLESGNLAKNWSDLLFQCRDMINEHTKGRENIFTVDPFDVPITLVKDVKDEQKFKIGDMVHKKYDQPKSTFGESNLPLPFRSGDRRFTTQLFRISNVWISDESKTHRYKLFDPLKQVDIYGSFNANELMKG